MKPLEVCPACQGSGEVQPRGVRETFPCPCCLGTGVVLDEIVDCRDEPSEWPILDHA
jgi:DnaJ-class molecular chaperone